MLLWLHSEYWPKKKKKKKNALGLLDKLFSPEEISRVILFTPKRSSKKPLDKERVNKWLILVSNVLWYWLMLKFPLPPWGSVCDIKASSLKIILKCHLSLYLSYFSWDTLVILKFEFDDDTPGIQENPINKK